MSPLANGQNPGDIGDECLSPETLKLLSADMEAVLLIFVFKFLLNTFLFQDSIKNPIICQILRFRVDMKSVSAIARLVVSSPQREAEFRNLKRLSTWYI